MDNERDIQNNEFNIPAQTVQGESPENGRAEERSDSRRSSDHSGSTHHHSSGEHSTSSHHHSSGSHSSSHRSSREHSGSSHHHSNSEQHSSSNREHRSSADSGAHRSSRHHSSNNKHNSNHKRRHQSDREKISFANRVKRFRHTVKSYLYKYRPKYLYRKFLNNYKKASLQKKFGYVVLMVSAFFIVGLFTKFALIDSFAPDSETFTIVKTTRAPIPAKPTAPDVEPGYELTELNDINNDSSFLSGFVVRLPKVISDTPDVIRINNEIEVIKEDIKAKYAASVDSDNNNVLYNYSYSVFSNDTMLLISIYKHVETFGTDPLVTHIYYFYNFVENALVESYDLATLFNINESQMVNIINDKLVAIGALAIENTAGVELSVNQKGRLSAKVFADKGAQGKVYVDVELA